MSATIELTNPFAGCSIRVTKVVDEGRANVEGKELHDYNEFYWLYTDGTLVVKKKSKIPTSDYLKQKGHEKI